MVFFGPGCPDPAGGLSGTTVPIFQTRMWRLRGRGGSCPQFQDWSSQSRTRAPDAMDRRSKKAAPGKAGPPTSLSLPLPARGWLQGFCPRLFPVITQLLIGLWGQGAPFLPPQAPYATPGHSGIEKFSRIS